MVQDYLDIETKILQSPFIQDRRPNHFLPRGKIWKIEQWKTGMPSLEVKPSLWCEDDEIRHYTCPQSIIKSALYGELFATMRRKNDQLLFHIGKMRMEYGDRAIEELYLRIIVNHVGTMEDRIIRAVRYEGGTRVTIEMVNDCKGLSSC